MWNVTIYSEGDLLHDEYLQNPEHPEEPVFNSCYDILSRIEYCKACSERLQAEMDFLIKHGGDLIGHTCYECVDFSNPSI